MANRQLGGDRGLLLRAGAAAELVLVAGGLALTAGLPAAAARDGIAALLALAMGIQNAVARRLAVPDLTTTVLTMTLTGIAADVRAKDHGRAGLGRRVLAVAAMFAGAVGGALLVLHVGTAPALGLATGLLAVVAAGAALRSGSRARGARGDQGVRLAGAGPGAHHQADAGRAGRVLTGALDGGWLSIQGGGEPPTGTGDLVAEAHGEFPRYGRQIASVY